jgi:hypothetical protein
MPGLRRAFFFGDWQIPIAFLVIAKSEATKQSSAVHGAWIASLRSQ